jgi:hypothetical protein
MLQLILLCGCSCWENIIEINEEPVENIIEINEEPVENIIEEANENVAGINEDPMDMVKMEFK